MLISAIGGVISISWGYVVAFPVLLVAGILALIGQKEKNKTTLDKGGSIMFLHTRKLLVGLLIGLLIVTLTGCGEPSGVKTGAESDSAKSEAQSKPEENTKKVAVNKEFSVNGLKITIGEVQVEKERILVGMTIKNETSDKLTFYPDQGSAVVGSMQLDANMFMTEGDVLVIFGPGLKNPV